MQIPATFARLNSANIEGNQLDFRGRDEVEMAYVPPTRSGIIVDGSQIPILKSPLLIARECSELNKVDHPIELPAMVRSDQEEYWNFLTHAAGCLLSIAGMFVLVARFDDKPTPILLSVFGFGTLLIVVYACSALSHFFREPQLRSLFRRLDQAFIYLLIVASYTPFSVAFQHGPWWSFLLVLMWSLAIVGCLSKLIFSHRVERVAVSIYLLLGWIPMIGGMPFAGLVPLTAVALIILGGLFYSAGTIFLLSDQRVWYFHAIWHLFVIAGSAVHFLAVVWFV